MFRKKHKNVLAAIDRILTQVPDSFGKLNFGLTEHETENNLGFKVRDRMYWMTRDGFALLAMGFTGKKALDFKVAYIGAFNEMASYIKNQREGLTIGTFIRPVPKARYCYQIVKVVSPDDEWRVEQWWCKRFGYDPDTDQPIKDGHQAIHYLSAMKQIAPDVWKGDDRYWYEPIYWRKMTPWGHQESMF